MNPELLPHRGRYERRREPRTGRESKLWGVLERGVNLSAGAMVMLIASWVILATLAALAIWR